MMFMLYILDRKEYATPTPSLMPLLILTTVMRMLHFHIEEEADCGSYCDYRTEYCQFNEFRFYYRPDHIRGDKEFKTQE
jgi:hypothetical protein